MQEPSRALCPSTTRSPKDNINIRDSYQSWFLESPLYWTLDQNFGSLCLDFTKSYYTRTYYKIPYYDIPCLCVRWSLATPAAVRRTGKPGPRPFAARRRRAQCRRAEGELHRGDRPWYIYVYIHTYIMYKMYVYAYIHICVALDMSFRLFVYGCFFHFDGGA